MKTHPSATRASRPRPLARHLVISAFAAAALSACGGGGGGNTPTPQPITGTAAAGAPVVGTVTVKDSTGASKTSTIAANGSYSVDVAGMTGPFVFMANGTVGGRTVSMVSAATAADVNKTINITPFTDLIVANLAGQAAASYFASPVFSKLTATELDAARQTLTARLLPILNALGVAAGFDLLRSSFPADHSGFDAVMDVVRVSTDTATQTATISDLVNHTQIQDDLASKTDATVIPTPAVDPNNTVTSLKGVEDTLAKFSAAFATSLPASNNAALRALMSGDFLDWGGGVDGFLSEQAVLVPGMVGVKQSGASIVAVKDNGATLDVEFLSAYKGGGSDRWQHEFKRNATSGVWQYAGNRKWVFTQLDSIVRRVAQTNGGWEHRGYFGWWITSRNIQAKYALVSGPGMPNWKPAALAGASLSAGMVFERSGPAFKIYSINGIPEATWLPECVNPDPFEVACVNQSGVNAGAVYTATLLDASGNVLGAPGTVTLAAKPYTPAEAAAASDTVFARIASTDPATKAGLTDGKRVTYTLTPPTNPAFTIRSAAIETPTTYFDTQVTGTTANVGTWSGGPPVEARALVTSGDDLGHRMVTLNFIN